MVCVRCRARARGSCDRQTITTINRGRVVYTVDLVTMRQRNVVTKTERNIRRLGVGMLTPQGAEPALADLDGLGEVPASVTGAAAMAPGGEVSAGAADAPPLANGGGHGLGASRGLQRR